MCDNTECLLKDFDKKYEQYKVDHKEDLEKLKAELNASALRAVLAATEIPGATSRLQPA